MTTQKDARFLAGVITVASVLLVAWVTFAWYHPLTIAETEIVTPGDHAMIVPQHRRMVGLLVTLALSIVVLLAVGYVVKISGIASMPASVKALPKSL